MINSAPPAVRFGANYTPSVDWMFSWLDLRPDDVRRDFEALAGLGLDHVRVLPLWPVLQPNRTLIRPAALADVRRVVDIAAEFGLDASIDVLQGHLSSFDFVPAWLLSWHAKNMFTDADALAGQVALVEALATALNDAPNFLGLTLGNEVNQFSDRPHPTPMPATPAQIDAWLGSLLAAAERCAPGRTHLHAEYDAVWFLDDHPFTPAQTARAGAVTAIHSWIFNGTAQQYGGTSFEAEHLAEYFIELSRGFQTDPDRPIWLQEVGAPSNCLTEDEAPGFLEATVRSVATTEGLWGVTWWCSHDVSRNLAAFPELEYSLGLLDNANQVKPIGRRFAELITELRAEPVRPQPRTVGVVLEVDETDTPRNRGSLGPRGAAFDQWMQVAKSGARPTFVLSSQTAEAELSRRGISELVAVPDEARPVHYQAVNTVV